MNIQWLLAIRYLSGRKLRSLLTTLAVVFGVLVIFSMKSMLPAMLQAFQVTMLAGADKVDLNISHRTSNAFPAAGLDAVRAVDGVRVAQGLLSRQINLPADFYDHDAGASDRVTNLTLVGLEPDDAQQMHNYAVQDGRFLQPGDSAACVVSASLADLLGLKIGGSLALPSTGGLVNLTIVGIRPPRTVPGNEEVLVTLTQARQIGSAPGQISTIEANYESGIVDTRRTEIEQAVAARLGPDYTFAALGTGSELFASLRLAQSIFNAFGFLALFMGGFIIFNTFRTLVLERRRDIGMLRAVGASRRTIIGIILTEGLLQGLIGTLAGMALGYTLARVGLAALSPMMENFVHLRIGAPVVTPGLVALTLTLGIGITLLAGLLPALSAGRITPMETLRPSLAGVNDRRTLGASAIAGIVLIGISLAVLFAGNESIITIGALLFMLGLVLLAPVLVRPIAQAFGGFIAARLAREGTGMLAQGNLTRQPSRSAVTASTSMIALAILVSVGGVVASLKGGFMDTVKVSLGSDYLFIPPAIAVWANDIGADTIFTDRLKAIDGVGPVSTLRYAATLADIKPVAVTKSQLTVPESSASGAATDAGETGMSVSLLGIDPQTYPETSGLMFSKGAPTEAFAALSSGRTMIVNGVFASTAGLKVGDWFPLMTPTGRQDYTVVAVANDYMNVKLITAYISQANMAADFNKREDVFIQLNLKPGADKPAVESALKQVILDYPQFSMISGAAYLAQTKELFDVAFASMYLLFIFMAIPSLIAMLNTLAIGVIERTREIGMLRAVGASQSQVRRMVVAEALLLAATGTAFGLVAGIYLCYALILAFSLAGFPVWFVFPWGGLVYATVVGLLFGLLAALIPARQAARMDIIQALRYE